MRVCLLPCLVALIGLPILFAADAPPDVRAQWEPPPHPSLPQREPVLTEQTAPPVGPPEGAPNVILITIDTWRADRLSLYGSPRPTSDFLDDLAKESVVFDRAVAPASWTWPTMASIASGLPPRAHTAQKPESILCPEVDTLAEVMHGSGWRTGFVGSNTYFEAHQEEFDQGFEFYFASGDEGATRILEYAGYFLEPIYGQPFFLHTHFFDPHCSYKPPGSSLSTVQTVPFGPTDSSDEEVGPLGWDMMAHPCHAVPPMVEGTPTHQHELATEASAYLDVYDAELHALDGKLKLLKMVLAASSAWDNAWVIITGDHGEEFGEHGQIGHGRNVHAETTWVPLIIRPPGGLPEGRRISTPVSLVDIHPTLTKALGLDTPESWTGRDLGAVFDGGDLPAAPVLSETIYRNDSWQALLQTDQQRLVVGGLLPIAEQYANDDTMDRRNLLAGPRTLRQRIETRMLAGRLHEELLAQSDARVCEPSLAVLDPAHWQQLKSLGYTSEVDPANRIRDLPDAAPDSIPVDGPPVEKHCADGRDDDGDGKTDCDDSDCDQHPNCGS
ncbi:MAG: sulfatase [Proteobacteria bacterium]|nr:sulfatase [Pseudomonadota bacterium]